jgi:hypothetical protein
MYIIINMLDQTQLNEQRLIFQLAKYRRNIIASDRQWEGEGKGEKGRGKGGGVVGEWEREGKGYNLKVITPEA